MRPTIPLLCGMLAAMLAAVSLARLPVAVLIFNLLFHLLLVRLMLRLPHGRRGILTGLPFVALYQVPFVFRRDITGLFDWVLETDTLKYLEEAGTLVVLPRHVGMPLFTFPYSPLEALGQAVSGLAGLGREGLHLQSAFLGAISVGLLYALLRRLGSSARIALLAAWVFGVTLAPWAVCGAIESFPVSLVLLGLLLHFLIGGGETAAAHGVPGRWLEPALLTALALGVSLENVYFLPLLILALIPRHRPAVLAATLGVAVLPCFLMLAAARAHQGPDFYHTWKDDEYGRHPDGIADHMDHFSRDYLEWDNLVSPASHAGVATRIFLMSMRGQVARANAIYPRRLIGVRPLAPANLAFLTALGALALLAAAGLVRRLRRAEPGLPMALAVLLTLLLARHGMILIFRPAETALIFAAPSLLALWALIGIGLREAPARHLPETVAAVLLAGLVVLLAASNLGFLLAIR